MHLQIKHFLLYETHFTFDCTIFEISSLKRCIGFGKDLTIKFTPSILVLFSVFLMKSIEVSFIIDILKPRKFINTLRIAIERRTRCRVCLSNIEKGKVSFQYENTYGYYALFVVISRSTP